MRVQHAVRKDHVRHGGRRQDPPRCKARVIPEAVDDHDIIIGNVVAEPRDEPRRVSVALPQLAAWYFDPAPQPECFHGAVEHPWRLRRVQRSDMGFEAAARAHARLAERAFDRAAVPWVNRTDDFEDAHLI